MCYKCRSTQITKITQILLNFYPLQPISVEKDHLVLFEENSCVTAKVKKSGDKQNVSNSKLNPGGPSEYRANQGRLR